MIIWLASYPKSGNTWIRSIISLLLFSKDGKMENFNLLSSIEQYPTKKYFFDLVKDYNDPIQIQKNWIPSQNIINRDKKIKFFKTHHIFCKYGDNAFTNSSNTLGVIHIVRDPRNLISSIKHHWSLETLEDAKNKIFDEQTMTGINIEINKEYSFPVMISSWNNHYNAWRPAHVHVSVFGQSFLTRLVTQMYFPGDPLLALDPIFNSIASEPARLRLVSAFDLALTEPARALGYRFDVVLRGSHATPTGL